MSTPSLTTTSYAILGLLALRPWTTYELAQQMDRALNRFWPRAKSKLYEEPKKLVAHGLAKATTESVGRRPRTMYSITAKGRRALAAWVPTPSAAPSLEFEALVKVFFAEHGSREDLLATLEATREWVREQETSTVDIPLSYLEGRGNFPERLPWLLLGGEFLSRFNDAIADWAEWAIGVVEMWPEDIRGAEPDMATLQHLVNPETRTSSRAASGSGDGRSRRARRPTA